MIILALTQKEIWIIVLVAVALLLLFAVFISVTLIIKKSRKYKSLLLTTNRVRQLFVALKEQQLKRIENISIANLLVVEIYNDYYNRYTYLEAKFDTPISSLASQLNKFIEKKNKIQAKETALLLKDKLNKFKNEYDALEKDLSLYLKPLSNFQAELISLKSEVVALKTEYDLAFSKYTIMDSVYHRAYEILDNYFTRIQQLIDIGEQEQTRELVNKIRNIIIELRNGFTLLPPHLYHIEVEIRGQLQQIDQLIALLKEKDLPLYHLDLDTRINEINRKIEAAIYQIMAFKVESLENDYQEIRTQLEQLKQDILKEESEAEYVLINKDLILQNSTNLYNQIVGLSKYIEKYHATYIISGEKTADIDNLLKIIPTLETDKRKIDSLLYNLGKVAYSSISRPLKNLEKKVSLNQENINSLENYFTSLKNNAERVFKEIPIVYSNLKQIESCANSFSAITNAKLEEYLKESFHELEEIVILIKQTPLNISLITEKFDPLSIEAKNSSLAFKNLLTDQQTANECMIFLNRLRVSDTTVNNLALECEKLYLHDKYPIIISKSEPYVKAIKEKMPPMDISLFLK